MLSCAFFGHRDTPFEAEAVLQQLLTQLVKEENVCLFYVGNNGNFDKLVLNCLKKLTLRFPYIQIFVVLAYLPKSQIIDGDFINLNTIFPEGLENVPKKFAISYRNKWIVDHADLVISYVNKPFGGAFKYSELASKKGKKVINIAHIN